MRREEERKEGVGRRSEDMGKEVDGREIWRGVFRREWKGGGSDERRGGEGVRGEIKKLRE
jgi:hypothetical protein